MMVHRLLDRYLNGGRSVQLQKLESQCDHCSQMEQTAVSAERASIKYKQVEFMEGHLGEDFAGVVTGVTEWGLFVEISENMCEGLVSVRDLADDYYDFDERNYRLVGRRTNTVYRLGDKVVIRVARTDIERRQLDFVLISDDGQPSSRAPEHEKPHKRSHKRTGKRETSSRKRRK
jgi:ribonuclease R